MSTPILATKLYLPPARLNVVLRPRLIERLNAGMDRKLTLISAPAGFGKTTLVSEWIASCTRSAAWLSLDEGDIDPARFLAYLVAALQTIAPTLGVGVLGWLQSPQPPPAETILTVLLNEITAMPDHFVLVLDDYHSLDAKPIDKVLTFLLDHLAPKMHLVIITREDPQLPLARLRAQSQLTELRVTDLRFSSSEAAGFLNQVMGLSLTAADIAALETRTEGWIAGLQLAAISLQGHQDPSTFIKSFSGNHRFVLDYLLEEVLHQQSEGVQNFLLRTSILERLCGPLCDAVLGDRATSSQAALEYLEHANLFIVPLDNERRWYRYHHLFADLLRQRLPQSSAVSPAADVAKLHIRASVWYEESGLELEAFHHAAAANDVERAERLIEGNGMPLHFRGAVAPVLSWLNSLPTAALDARPGLWTAYASVMLVSGHVAGAEQKLQAAEAALNQADPGVEPDVRTRDFIGRVAAIRATVAATQNQVDAIIVHSRRALEYLHPNNLAFRTSTIWKLGYAYQLQGDRVAASRAYTDVITIGQPSGNTLFTIMATIGLGSLQHLENQLDLAAQTYRQALQLFGDQPLSMGSESHLGLARIAYERNDLDAALQHGQQSVRLAGLIENNHRLAACELFLVHLKRTQGNPSGAAVLLAQVDQFVRQHTFVHLQPEVAAAQVMMLLDQGNLATAAQLAQAYPLPLSQARVHMAQGDPATALVVLERWRQEIEARGWAETRITTMLLQALALQAQGQNDAALRQLAEALALAEPGRFIRSFVDEGLPMAQLLAAAAARGMMPIYVGRLLAVFEAEQITAPADLLPAQPLIEPLSQRELEVLQLIAQGLSNSEIGERLFLALSTVKGHNREIFGKLQVQRRTEAVARARELGLV